MGHDTTLLGTYTYKFTHRNQTAPGTHNTRLSAPLNASHSHRRTSHQRINAKASLVRRRSEPGTGFISPGQSPARSAVLLQGLRRCVMRQHKQKHSASQFVGRRPQQPAARDTGRRRNAELQVFAPVQAPPHRGNQATRTRNDTSWGSALLSGDRGLGAGHPGSSIWLKARRYGSCGIRLSATAGCAPKRRFSGEGEATAGQGGQQ